MNRQHNQACVATDNQDCWTDSELALLNNGQRIFGPSPCKIARLLMNKTCKQVQDYLQRHQVAGGQTTQGRGRRTKAKKSAPKKTINPIVAHRLQQQGQEIWPQYEPCTCYPVCGANCPCVGQKHFCEKFCSCGPLCRQRFRGCTCKGRCSSKQCPCYAAGRECDPDMCKGCCPLPDHSSTAAAACCPVTTQGSNASTPCYNMRIRLRQHKRLLMGLSGVSGWGAFVWEECKKDQFLGEYTGDLISQEEADRRGKVYDIQDCSYLFNLNEKWVLDARHRGNKLRFANHSSNPNCYARIVMVDGEHRVGIYAKRDLMAGEELTYDYRYDYHNAPPWAKNRK